MVGILILTHGGLAVELLAAAKTIAGDLEGFEALALSWVDSLDEVEDQVGKALARLDHGDGVLVLTDVFGGTPSNVAKKFKEVRQIEAVSGVNLPMVLRLGCLSQQAKGQNMTLVELAGWIRDKGRESICSEPMFGVNSKPGAAKKVASNAGKIGKSGKTDAPIKTDASGETDTTEKGAVKTAETEKDEAGKSTAKTAAKTGTVKTSTA